MEYIKLYTFKFPLFPHHSKVFFMQKVCKWKVMGGRRKANNEVEFQ